VTGQAPSGRPSGLTAVRFALDPGPTVDPFALAGARGILFHAGGRPLVGLGQALAIDLPEGLDSPSDLARATDALASLPYHDHVGSASSGLMAFATLPFERSSSAALTVPEVIYGVDETGVEWATVVGPDPTDMPTTPDGLRSWLLRRASVGAPPPHSSSPAEAGPRQPQIVPRSSDASFLEMVVEALASIDRHQVLKVVLARHADVAMGSPIDVPDLLRRWQSLEPNCTVFSMPTPDGQFMGATPELLVARRGSTILSRPLAGTAERFIGSEGSALPGELLESTKDATEHRRVVDAIDAALRPLCSDLDVPARPGLVRLSNIVHLGTSLNGTLKSGPTGRPPSALELVGALHPTPAVGGVPSGAARDLIGRLEPESRGHYAGPVGYLDARGDGQWMLGIRSLTVEGANARLSAGVGIVDGSEPATELIETNLKLTAVLQALAPGLAMAWWEGTGHRSVAS
jgi:menaquinone-specific isochorismate synthase